MYVYNELYITKKFQTDQLFMAPMSSANDSPPLYFILNGPIPITVMEDIAIENGVFNRKPFGTISYY